MRLKIVLLLMIGLVVLMAGCAGNGWTPLLDGETLNGWRLLNGDAEYKIEDGAIVGISKMNTPNTFLATEEEYGDFILEYEAMMDNGLNSGVQIRSLSLPEYQDGRVHGYQVELDASARAWTGGLYDEARRGWLYNLECNPKAKTAYRHEDWNRFRVEAIGSHIRVWLNGAPAVDLIDDMTSRGFIALQVHGIGDNQSLAGRTVRFRNIRIKTGNLDRLMRPLTREIPQISYLTNRLTEREEEEGWKLLWDGRTTEGWRGARLDRFPERGWVIDEGVLKVMEGSGSESAYGGDIVTVEKYKNFILELDFRYTRGANSGIKYFVDTGLNKGPGSSIGCEYQILDDRLHPDAKAGAAGNRTLASLYDLIPADAKAYAPDESIHKRVNAYGWNRARVEVNGRLVRHFLNGIKVVEYERGTQMWRALVARSKYVIWPGFGEQEEGRILLQDHGNEVHFKNIKIKILGG